MAKENNMPDNIYNLAAQLKKGSKRKLSRKKSNDDFYICENIPDGYFDIVIRLRDKKNTGINLRNELEQDDIIVESCSCEGGEEYLLCRAMKKLLDRECEINCVKLSIDEYNTTNENTIWEIPTAIFKSSVPDICKLYHRTKDVRYITPSLRIYLLQKYLERSNYFEEFDMFPLHETHFNNPSKEITDVYKSLITKWSSLTDPSINDLRQYFGEEIGLYFGWSHKFAKHILSIGIIGLFFWFYGIYNSVETLDEMRKKNLSTIVRTRIGFGGSFNNKTSFPFGLLFLLYYSVVKKLWNVDEKIYSHQWGVDGFLFAEKARRDYKENGSNIKRLLKYCCSILFIMVMILFVFASVLGVTTLRIVIISQKLDGIYSNLAYAATVLLNTFSTLILKLIYTKLIRKINDWECHRTLSDHNNALALKLFIFQFVNTFSSLFYLAYLRPNLDYLNGFFSQGEKWMDPCDTDQCTNMLSIQVLSHIILIPFSRLIWTFIIPLFINKYKNRKDFPTEDWTNYIQKERKKPKSDDFTIQEYIEKLILHAIVTFFTGVLPIAPFIISIIHFIDNVIDRRRLLFNYQRPLVNRAENIGIFNSIQSFIIIISMMSNGYLFANHSSLNTDLSNSNKLYSIIGIQNLGGIFIILINILVGPSHNMKVNLQKKKEEEIKFNTKIYNYFKIWKNNVRKNN
ncbi:hypothetical protein SNEBB_003779 [Seison nebaliae]|nr:hypothetical protein SNEBB_003779 [Seison nebaliae]